MSSDKSQFGPPKFDRDGALISPKPAFVDEADKVSGPTVLTVEQIRTGAQPTQQEEQPSQEQQYAESVVGDQPEEVESSHEDIEQSAPEAPAEEPKKNKYMATSKEMNLRRLREDRDRAQQERDLMARELELMRRVQPQPIYNQQQQSPQHVHQEEADIDIDFGDDDLIEGKHLKKIVSSLNNKFKQNSYKSAQEVARAQEAAIELQLRAKYPDFDSVVNNANLKDLEAAYPELAASMHSTPSLYNKAVSAYTMIKNLGIHEEHEEEAHMAEKQKVRRNAVKPRPSNSNTQTHQSPLSQAGSFAELTPELMDQMRREMAAARKRL